MNTEESYVAHSILIFFVVFHIYIGLNIISDLMSTKERMTIGEILIFGFYLSLVFALTIWAIFKIINIPIKMARKKFIENYEIPKSVLEKFKVHYPNLTAWEIEDVVNGLKIYFICCLTKDTYAWMPSKVVDMLWHEFILNSVEYEKFCKKAFGKFFHHIPCNYKTSPQKKEEGLKIIWQHSCQEAGMDSRTAYKLPLLFAIDEHLNIPDVTPYDLAQANHLWGYVPPPSNYDSGGGGDGGGSGGCGGGGGGCGGGGGGCGGGG